MLRAGIIGVTGYVGIEILRLLLQHPGVKITQIMTKTYAGLDITKVYPHLANRVFLKGNQIDLNVIIKDCDVVFISLPHGHAIDIVQPLLDAGKRIIDLGADFRLKKSSDYQHWYKAQSAPEALLSKAVYGLPEITSKETIAKANLIANPGCHPTAVILASAPMLKEKIINPDDCIFDIKTSLSGTGRTPTLGADFCEIAENVLPYNLAGLHRHTPEIEQELSLIVNKSIRVQFTPQLIPMIRGILSTAYFKLNRSISEQEIYDIFKNAYQHEYFIRICPLYTTANINNVRGTNYCDISIHVDIRTQRLIVLSAIDNLIKGAAGQAIQNMNLMYQLPETTALNQYVAIYP